MQSPAAPATAASATAAPATAALQAQAAPNAASQSVDESEDHDMVETLDVDKCLEDAGLSRRTAFRAKASLDHFQS